jgi:hypothetical protein
MPVTPPSPENDPAHCREIRRLFTVVGTADVIQRARHWSCFRRQHQAEARRYHFRRRLKIRASTL